MANFNEGENPVPSSLFNRSLTIHSSYDFTKKPMSIERLSSVKKLNNSSSSSSFGSSMVSAGNFNNGKVKKLCSIFEMSPHNSSTDLHSLAPPSPLLSPKKLSNSDSALPSEVRLPGTEDRVVIFFTSLRGIRRTYIDSCAIRMIFKGFRVNLDERDTSMDSAYRKELQSLLGEKKTVILPQVFIKGKYIGSADVVKQLNETGELAKMLKGVAVRAVKPGFVYICEGCGDMRFMPCSNCSGSRKVFDESEEQLKKCPECNENGLIRCPECCCY